MQSSSQPEILGFDRRLAQQGVAAAALPARSLGWRIAQAASIRERVCAKAAVSSLSHGFLGELLDLILQVMGQVSRFWGYRCAEKAVCRKGPAAGAAKVGRQQHAHSQTDQLHVLRLLQIAVSAQQTVTCLT